MDDARSSTALRGDHDQVPFVIFGDFICPWSYSALDVVDRVAAAYGLLPRWHAHLLHPEVPPEGIAMPAERKETAEAWIRDTAPEAAAVMRFPDRVQFSFRAFEGLEMARDHHVDLAYTRAVFDSLWIDGLDIADVEVLAAAAERAGLDRDELADALARGTYVDRAFAAVDQARRLGIAATPTFILGRIRINGWHYTEVFESVLDQQGIAPL